MAFVAKRTLLIIAILLLSWVVLLSYLSHVAWEEYLITRFSSNAEAPKEFSRNCIKSHFQGILVVVNYNFPFYDTVPLISLNYQEVFPKIVICGIVKSRIYDVMKVDTARGYYAYECLGKAIRLYPGFEGYLYVNDDMIVNWWNFVKFDRNKIWAGAPILAKHRAGQRPLVTNWPWWIRNKGAERCENTHMEIKNLTKHNRSLGATTYKKILSTLLQNGKNETYCFSGWSDLYYIPRRLSTEYQILSEMFFRNRVYLEISVPTILSFLELHENMEKAHGIYLPDLFGQGTNFIAGKQGWTVYSLNKTLFIHPVKFHHSKAEANREKLVKIVSYGRKYLQC